MICPVKAIVSCLAVWGSKPRPVFTLFNGRMLTRDILILNLKKILTKLDLPTCHNNTHSFRIGAATSTKQAGISDVHIKTLGCSGKVMPISTTSEIPLNNWPASLSKLLLPKTLEQNVMIKI